MVTEGTDTNVSFFLNIDSEKNRNDRIMIKNITSQKGKR